MTTDEVVHYLRSNPEYSELVRDSYLNEDLWESAERFQASGEFLEVLTLLGRYLHRGKVLDMGAGNGIASRAFAKFGAQLVYALEPEPSNEVGRGAILRLCSGMPIEVIGAPGEHIPLIDEEVDVVYARQVLHHAGDLFLLLRECARVLKKGGVFLACREHVVDDEQQLKVFLDSHPVHRFTGKEHAYRLSRYREAIEASGLRIERIMRPWDSVINAYPAVKTADELRRLPRTLLERRFGRAGSIVSLAPGINQLIWMWLRRPIPGRFYSFLAYKI